MILVFNFWGIIQFLQGLIQDLGKGLISFVIEEISTFE